MSFFKWLSQLNDLRLLATVSRLHKEGHLSAARRKVFEIVVSREDRFGKGTEPCAEPISWLAQEHFQRALEAIFLLMHLEERRKFNQLSLAPSGSFQFLLVEQALASKWRHEMKKAFMYFALAKYGLPSSTGASSLQLEIELYLGITTLAGPFGSDVDDHQDSAMVYLNTALNTARRLLESEAEYHAFDLIDHVTEVISTFVSDANTKAMANQLKIDVETERAARADFANQMALLGRHA